MGSKKNKKSENLRRPCLQAHSHRFKFLVSHMCQTKYGKSCSSSLTALPWDLWTSDIQPHHRITKKRMLSHESKCKDDNQWQPKSQRKSAGVMLLCFMWPMMAPSLVSHMFPLVLPAVTPEQRARCKSWAQLGIPWVGVWTSQLTCNPEEHNSTKRNMCAFEHRVHRATPGYQHRRKVVWGIGNKKNRFK